MRALTNKETRQLTILRRSKRRPYKSTMTILKTFLRWSHVEGERSSLVQRLIKSKRKRQLLESSSRSQRPRKLLCPLWRWFKKDQRHPQKNLSLYLDHQRLAQRNMTSSWDSWRASKMRWQVSTKDLLRETSTGMMLTICSFLESSLLLQEKLLQNNARRRALSISKSLTLKRVLSHSRMRCLPWWSKRAPHRMWTQKLNLARLTTR